jgi:hypothetical protein
MEGNNLVDYDELKKKIQRQADKVWDTASIEAWLRRITANGIPNKTLEAKDIVNRKQEILDGVRSRAEDCTFLSRI